MGHDITTNLPLHLTWVISWILLKIQILVRLFIQKGGGGLQKLLYIVLIICPFVG